MIRQNFGCINRRIDVGYDKANDTIYIHSSSNCINFSMEEMDCLISVLSVIHNTTFEHAYHFLNRLHIKLWEPYPPPAEEKLC